MKRYIVAIAVVLSVVTTAAQAPVMNPGESIAFDYDDVLYAQYSVTRFEVQWDSTSASWTILNATPFKGTQTTPGSTSYAFQPPFSNGNHTVYVRACNLVGCGVSSDPFAFAFAVASVPPKAFSNFRVVKQ